MSGCVSEAKCAKRSTKQREEGRRHARDGAIDARRRQSSRERDEQWDSADRTTGERADGLRQEGNRHAAAEGVETINEPIEVIG